MKLIAHRGKIFNNDIGNTKTTILKALSQSYISGIECDVRLTKDKKVVILHDPIIDFVSNGKGIVKQKTLKELQQYTFGNDTISTLQELLQEIHSEKLILIELKEEEKTLVEKVNQIIMQYPYLNIVIISFWYSSLTYLRKINKSVKIGILIGYFLNQNKLYNHFDYNLFSYHYLDQIYMHKKIMYFTINKKREAKEIKEKNNDIYIITDTAFTLKDLI